jgi:transcriptional regulator with XRE-family HTH domain
MADFSRNGSIGTRIAAARRARGYRTQQSLVDAIDVPTITTAILMNIEAGRKTELDLSQLLNIAMTLKVPVSFLVAPIATPDAPIDLPNLSHEFDGMTAAQFDSWLASIPNAGHIATTAPERNDRTELAALRELQTLQRELRRLKVVADIEDEIGINAPRRLDDLHDQARELLTYLQSAGWDVQESQEPLMPTDAGGAASPPSRRGRAHG